MTKGIKLSEYCAKILLLTKLNVLSIFNVVST